MQSATQAEFKTLLSKEEYTRLMDKFKGNRIDYQTNHYFDTSRFSLKASDTSLRVRERDTLELTLKRKKSYTIQDFTLSIDDDIFEEIKKTGYLPEGNIKNEVMSLIGPQKVVNFMSLSTKRLALVYGNGIIFIDESKYLGITDYELQYEAKNQHDGKKEFIQLLSDLNIKYKKTEKKIKRAYNALKTMI